jgi:hypothetical protein
MTTPAAPQPGLLTHPQFRKLIAAVRRNPRGVGTADHAYRLVYRYCPANWRRAFADGSRFLHLVRRGCLHDHVEELLEHRDDPSRLPSDVLQYRAGLPAGYPVKLRAFVAKSAMTLLDEFAGHPRPLRPQGGLAHARRGRPRPRHPGERPAADPGPRAPGGRVRRGASPPPLPGARGRVARQGVVGRERRPRRGRTRPPLGARAGRQGSARGVARGVDGTPRQPRVLNTSQHQRKCRDVKSLWFPSELDAASLSVLLGGI